MNTFVSYLPKLLVYFPRNYDDFCALCHDIIIPGDLSRLDLHAEAVAAASLLKGGGQAGRSGENIVGGGGGGWGGWEGEGADVGGERLSWRNYTSMHGLSPFSWIP